MKDCRYSVSVAVVIDWRFKVIVFTLPTPSRKRLQHTSKVRCSGIINVFQHCCVAAIGCFAVATVVYAAACLELHVLVYCDKYSVRKKV